MQVFAWQIFARLKSYVVLSVPKNKKPAELVSWASVMFPAFLACTTVPYSRTSICLFEIDSGVVVTQLWRSHASVRVQTDMVRVGVCPCSMAAQAC